LIDTLISTTPGQVITGGVVATGGSAIVNTAVPHTSLVGTILGYVVPFGLSLLSHLVLRLVNKKTDANIPENGQS